MTNISSETLFHFTNTKDNLTSILENGFRPNLCLENYSFIGETGYETYIPIVCFCDIPLSKIQNHSKTYGNFAIGLSKTWAILHKITPIMYVYKDSPILRHIFDMSNSIKPNIEKENTLSPPGHLYVLLQYMKLYEGKLPRKYNNPDTIKFYNEREWRYVVPYTEVSFLPPISIFDKNYEDEDSLKFYKEMNKFTPLTFTPNDIEYIIVSENDEIPHIISDIERIMKDKYKINDENIIKQLIAKVNSIERIRKDF